MADLTDGIGLATACFDDDDDLLEVSDEVVGLSPLETADFIDCSGEDLPTWFCCCFE